MSPLILTIIISISTVAIGILIFFICYLTQKKYNDFLLQNSVCLKTLNDINCRYKFYPYQNFDQYHTYDNVNFYNNISCKDYLIYQLQFISKQLFYQIKKVDKNKQLYSKYIIEVKSLNQFGKFQSPSGKLRINKLINKEHRLIEKNTYSAPTTQFFLTVTLCCSKINGQLFAQKRETFSADDISIFIKRLNNKKGNFCIDQEIWDAICRVERGKVSNKMRFSIYKRDGYRCRKCGISSRYAKLEVDHIIPIAKGGKSVYNNLQTQCHKCNVEKGNNLY